MTDDMLRALGEHLRLDGQQRDTVLRELQSHLEESRRELQLSGFTPEAARRESADRFGDPIEVAGMLSHVHRRRAPRLQLVLAATFVIAGLSAAFGAAGTWASTTHHSVVRAHAPQRHVTTLHHHVSR